MGGRKWDLARGRQKELPEEPVVSRVGHVCCSLLESPFHLSLVFPYYPMKNMVPQAITLPDWLRHAQWALHQCD